MDEHVPTSLHEFMQKAEEQLPAVMGSNVVPGNFMLPGDRGWHNRIITPNHMPIPMADGFDKPAWDKVPKHTPKDSIESVYDDAGKFMYKAVKIGYVTRMLYELFPTGFGEETVDAGWANIDRATGETGEFRVHLQIVAPGLFRPVQGVGSSVFRSANKQDTEAKTIASAYTSALKNAAKKLNIGRDFDEDDPELAKRTDERVRIIGTLLGVIEQKELLEEALVIVAKHEPTAVIGGKVIVAAIDSEKLEPVQRDLQRLNNSVKRG